MTEEKTDNTEINEIEQEKIQNFPGDKAKFLTNEKDIKIILYEYHDTPL